MSYIIFNKSLLWTLLFDRSSYCAISASVLQVLIPISLYVSIEIVKLGQIYFIQNDLDLYDSRLDTGIQCRALNITEDLGQIQYLFSDKTGTLTENRMLFRRCTVAGKEYPHNENGEFFLSLFWLDNKRLTACLTPSATFLHRFVYTNNEMNCPTFYCACLIAFKYN